MRGTYAVFDGIDSLVTQTFGLGIFEEVAEAGSNSQRNAERKGFRIAYTHTKWRLMRPDKR
jgi:hypothetical protein